MAPERERGHNDGMRQGRKAVAVLEGHSPGGAPARNGCEGKGLRRVGKLVERSGSGGVVRVARIREETRGGHGGHGGHRELLELEREAGEGAGSEARLLVCLNGSGEGYI